MLNITYKNILFPFIQYPFFFKNNLSLQTKKIAMELRNDDYDLDSISMSTEKAELIQKLWLSEGIKKVFEKKNQLQVDEGLEYFMDKIIDLCQDSYCPTIEDIMKVRVKSTGLKEIQFPLSGKIFRVVDVGGQRNERKKWIHCFPDVSLIIYVMALNEFDLQLALFQNFFLLTFFKKVMTVFLRKIQRRTDFKSLCTYSSRFWATSSSLTLPLFSSSTRRTSLKSKLKSLNSASVSQSTLA